MHGMKKIQVQGKRVLLMGVLGLLAVSLAGCDKKEEESMIMVPTVEMTEEWISYTVDPDVVTSAPDVSYRDSLGTDYIEGRLKVELGENYWPSIAMDSLSNLGVSEELVEEFIYRTTDPSLGVDQIAIMKATEGNASKIEDALNAYRDQVLGDFDATDEEIVKIQAAEIASYGNYVVLVELGANTATEAMAQAGSKSQEELAALEMDTLISENQKALAIIASELQQ